MLHRTLRSVWYTCVCLLCLNVLQQPAQAGPPLICHPYQIGDAPSLPWSNTAEKFAGKPDYELSRLVNDTLALLTPDTPVIVRMETLRRATIYSLWMATDREPARKAQGRKSADELLAQLLARLSASAGKGKAATLARFDAGYLLSSLRQSGWHQNQHTELDAYALVRQAAEQSGDATMQFAAALCTNDKPLQRAHLQKAVAGAPEGSLLARNLVSLFSNWGRDLASLRTNLATTQQ
jgi:hypothetical protein